MRVFGANNYSCYASIHKGLRASWRAPNKGTGLQTYINRGPGNITTSIGNGVYLGVTFASSTVVAAA
jgi:hypothetical protein